jgi:multidrug efflux pump subunit AcrA (membrane-fusion protein)
VRFSAGEGTVLAVPKRAITRAGGSDGVFTVGARDNVARLSMITLGAEFDGRVEVLSGLSSGERVALSSIDKLSDGARVEVRR